MDFRSYRELYAAQRKSNSTADDYEELVGSKLATKSAKVSELSK